MNKKLVITPTYNESKNIKPLIEAILKLGENFDILVIDDNSPDGTASIVKAISAGNPSVHLMQRAGKLGYGTAYIQGFGWALERGYEYIFSMDADLSHQPKYLPGMANLLNNHDVVIGSRYVNGGGIEGWPVKRKLLSRMGNTYAKLVTGIPVNDCTGGFNGLKRKVVEALIERRLHSEGYSFLLEVKHFAWRSGFSIAETPIVFVDRIAGVSKISKSIIFEALLTAWKLRFKHG